MADIKKGANEPFLYDDQTDRITGVKNSDGSEKKFVYTDGSSGPVAITGGMTVTPNADAPTSNVVLGPSAGAAMESGAASNTAVGHQAGLSISTGNGNTIVGASAGDAITDATDNTLIGFQAGGGITSGSQNTAVGRTALLGNQIGSGNIAIGWDALNVQTSSNSVGVGAYALRECDGQLNVAVGNEAGRFRGASTDLNTSATSSVFIGHRARAANSAQTNQVVIAGTDGLGDGSNTTVIGNTSTTSTRIAGTATSRFEISGDTMRITGTRTPASNAAGTAGDFTFGTDGATTYLYYCIASGNWGRVALTTGY